MESSFCLDLSLFAHRRQGPAGLHHGHDVRTLAARCRRSLATLGVLFGTPSNHSPPVNTQHHAYEKKNILRYPLPPDTAQGQWILDSAKDDFLQETHGRDIFTHKPGNDDLQEKEEPTKMMEIVHLSPHLCIFTFSHGAASPGSSISTLWRRLNSVLFTDDSALGARVEDRAFDRWSTFLFTLTQGQDQHYDDRQVLVVHRLHPGVPPVHGGQASLPLPLCH